MSFIIQTEGAKDNFYAPYQESYYTFLFLESCMWYWLEISKLVTFLSWLVLIWYQFFLTKNEDIQFEKFAIARTVFEFMSDKINFVYKFWVYVYV